MMIDIDRFKEVNDTRGHAAGDRILRLTADLLRDNLRSMDLVARLGGDEFLVVMPATVPTEASLAAERLRTRFLSEVAGMDRDLNISLSIGVAVRAGIDGKTATVEGLMKAADRALYAAKAEGRNCVRLIPAA
jgi:two-component system cell cycle response regulator